MINEKNRARALRKQQMAEYAAANPEQPPHVRVRATEDREPRLVVTVAKVKEWLKRAGYSRPTARQHRKAVNSIRVLAIYDVRCES